MKEDNGQPMDEKLSTLLRAGRPVAELPPAFHAAVWRRIEKGDVRSASMLERLARFFVVPRLATAAITIVVIFAAGLGTLRGLHKGEQQARDRYVASVDPSYPRR